jgi:hypothetical protein
MIRGNSSPYVTKKANELINYIRGFPLTRASVIVAAAFGSLMLGKVYLSYGQSPPAPNNNFTVEEWMNKWMVPARDANEPLYLGRFVEPIYFLVKPIGWLPNPGQTYEPVNVPIGFVSDLASIPRPFWSLLRPDGNYAYGAIIHDYLYWFQTRPRAEADEIFKFVMQDFKVDDLTVNVIYDAVRVAGSAAWDENNRLRSHGERRVLKEFPTSPVVFWRDWKAQAYHFVSEDTK